MVIRNVRQYEGLSFEEYQALPGNSFSTLRSNGEKIAVTNKMRFGSRVDAYLFTPDKYDGVDYGLVKPVALEVKRFIGGAIGCAKPQLSVTAEFHHDGYMMQYKGRPDLPLPGRMVIDLKVSELPIIKAIEFFRYDFQVTGYGSALSTDMLIILSIHPKTKKISIQRVNPAFDFWHHHIVTSGTYIM